ncbi:MFS transporter [Pseudomaricurvus alkylphenolicus]|uniref:MFS transporter n=1 Tax=Pseudomaricurvus alkylphenolicus TaxID=1306991 RepID=UPI00141EC6EB|nr:MFS transporter [Pseudomaricurvus alkylphenolicus]NIB38904.1 MFS transporter [Pseudomaricurvus alkylphenolicus]
MAIGDEGTPLIIPNLFSRITLVTVAGAQMIIVQPGLLSGYIEQAGFSEQQGGLLIAFEMTGYALATLALTVLSKIFCWRVMVRAALVLLAVANVCCVFVETYEWFVVLRLVAGVSAGVVTSLGFSSIGLTASADRNFGLAIMLAMVYGALVLGLLPVIFSLAGLDGLLLVFTAMSVLGLRCSSALLTRSESKLREGSSVEASAVATMPLPMRQVSVVLASVAAYFVAQGVVWPYLFVFGTSAGVDDASVSTGLMWCQFSGIGGALLATFIGNRASRLMLLAAGIGVVVAALLMFLFLRPSTGFEYTITVLICNFGFCLAHPYLLANVAAFDHKGRLVVLAMVAQTLGGAVGPALGALLLGEMGYAGMQWFAVAALGLSVGLMAMASMGHGRNFERGDVEPASVR